MGTYIVVSVIENDLPTHMSVHTYEEEAELAFFDMCEQKLSNFDEYTYHDKMALLEQGYERYGCGKICIYKVED